MVYIACIEVIYMKFGIEFVPNEPIEIVINPTPPSIDPSISRQLKYLYRVCVGSFVILLLFFIAGMGILCKLCLNRY